MAVLTSGSLRTRHSAHRLSNIETDLALAVRRGLMARNQYRHIAARLLAEPGSLLVFGLGHDSALWSRCASERAVFVEDDLRLQRIGVLEFIDENMVEPALVLGPCLFVFGQQVSQLQKKIELVQLPPARLYLLVQNDDDRKQTREPCCHPAIERSAQLILERSLPLLILPIKGFP